GFLEIKNIEDICNWFLVEKMREGLRSNTRLIREREMLDLNKEPSENSQSPFSTDYFSAEEDRRDVDSGVNLDIARNANADDGGDEGEEGEGKDEKELKSDGGGNSEGVVGKDESHLPLTNVGLVVEGVNQSEVLGLGNSAADVCVWDVGASNGADESGGAVGKKRRGRKRKVVGSGLSGAEAVSLKEERAKVAKVREDGSKHEVLEYVQGNDMGGAVAAEAGVSTSQGRQEVSKGRRGRKRKVLESSSDNARPQIVGRVLRSRTMSSTVAEKQACREENACVGDEDSDLDVKIIGEEKIDESEQLARRGRKKLKGRRGRPKMHGKNGKSKVALGKKTKIGSGRNTNIPRAKVKVKNLVKDHKKKVASDFPKVIEKKSIHSSEGEIGRNEQKQLLRNQIISILIEAGWTIDYRPRANRDYQDAVYVDHQGRTYWSVTLAYKRLKQMVEDGTADAKAMSAFTPIPEDELSKLYRISKEKGKKCKKLPKVGRSKSGKGPDKTSAARSTDLSQCKEKLNAKPTLGEKSSRKKKVDSSEQENSVIFSGRRKSKSRRESGRNPCALLARCSEKDPVADGFKMYKGKHTLLSWMIDWETVSLGGKVQYMSQDRTALMLEGRITREGILCYCCDNVVTDLDFESHAGSTLGQPYNNIFLESGPSLLQCMRESWSKQEVNDNIGFQYVNVDAEDPNDDTCNICADGGDLTCCDGCPSTFHQNCLQMQDSPDGYWRCVYCSCKFCGVACGRDSLSDDYELFTCYFCEEKFHVHCRLVKDAIDIHSEDLSFCGMGCQKLFETLQKLLGVRHELEAGYSWTILRRQDVSCNATDSSKVVCNSKLAIALSIMDECFEPIIDSRSKINVIQSVIYSCGSNFKRLNCCRFCTFILERGDEIVSAAAIRVHGNHLAEMPFIGTRPSYRRQGMFRRLLTAIEMALSSIHVEKLVIPAVSELSETWTKVFGFLPLEESKRQEMKYMSLISFPGTNMLQKPLQKDQATEGKTCATGMELSKPTIENVKTAITPARNVNATSGNNLQENAEAAAAAVEYGASVTHGCSIDKHSITNGVEFTISSNNEMRHDFAGHLQLHTCVDTEENFGDKLVSLTLNTVAHKSSSDPIDETSLKSLSPNILPCPQPCLKSSNQSGSTLWNGESMCNATAHPEVARLPTTHSCNTGGGPEIDPSLDC
ncbi:hypothetical protein ACH5RR_021579, partial [Cinchona calisaya]